MGEMSAGELKEDILLDTPSYISMERKDSGVQVSVSYTHLTLPTIYSV